MKLTSDTYTTAVYGEVPLVDAAATYDAETNRTAIFLVNRSLDAASTVTVALQSLGEIKVLETHILADTDIYAANTLVTQKRVGVAPNPTAQLAQGRLTVELPAVSWTAVALG